MVKKVTLMISHLKASICSDKHLEWVENEISIIFTYCYIEGNIIFEAIVDSYSLRDA